jgi:hypothetical protein
VKAITEADRHRLEILDQLKPALQETVDEMERGLAPFWEGTAESHRTVITLSSGALIASISVLQFLAEEAATPRAGWLMPACWILFGVSILAAMTAQAAATGMRLLRMNATHQATHTIITEQADITDPAAIAQEIIRRVEARFNSDMKRFNGAVNIVRVSFIGAFASMIAFAIINLPF